VEGDLAVLLQSALKDADLMYNNNGQVLKDRYGMDEKKALKYWWQALSKIEKQMKKDKNVAMAKVVSEVNKKAIEPGYNFYQIDANKVIDHAGMMSGLLVFYVFYTMWWGYAIFYLFDGIGLTMKKAKVKKRRKRGSGATQEDSFAVHHKIWWVRPDRETGIGRTDGPPASYQEAGQRAYRITRLP
jgi:hypothetical protein